MDRVTYRAKRKEYAQHGAQQNNYDIIIGGLAKYPSHYLTITVTAHPQNEKREHA